jgi:hypothetical protein
MGKHPLRQYEQSGIIPHRIEFICLSHSKTSDIPIHASANCDSTIHTQASEASGTETFFLGRSPKRSVAGCSSYNSPGER